MRHITHHVWYRYARHARWVERLLIVSIVILLSTLAYLAQDRMRESIEYQTQSAAAAERGVIAETSPGEIGYGVDVPPAHKKLPEVGPRVHTDVQLPVPVRLQEQALSCEAAAVVMALQFKGVSVSEEKVMDLVGYDTTPHSEKIWGNPHVAFVGDIGGMQPTTGYGVYWEPVAHAANSYRPAFWFTQGTVQMLTDEISRGNAVVIWVNAGSGRRIDWSTPTGEHIIAIAGEHAVTVTGFRGTEDRPTHIIVNDPSIGQLVYTADDLKNAWGTLGYAGVVIQ